MTQARRLFVRNVVLTGSRSQYPQLLHQGVRGGIEPAVMTFTESYARPLHHEHHRIVSASSSKVSTPTRTRTWNASFEASDDGPFHHRGLERKARDSNPHLGEENRLSRAARPTVSGYLP